MTTHEDNWGDEWDESEEICFNCEHMGYFSDGYALMEYCNLKQDFIVPTSYCNDFKNRWKHE